PSARTSGWRPSTPTASMAALPARCASICPPRPQPAETEAADNIRTLAMVEAAIASSRSGGWVEVSADLRLPGGVRRPSPGGAGGHAASCPDEPPYMGGDTVWPPAGAPAAGHPPSSLSFHGRLPGDG